PLAAVTGRENAIADRLVHGFGQAMELADVEIDPAARIASALFRNEHDLALDDAGIADNAAAGLDDDIRQGHAETSSHGFADRLAVGFERRNLAVIARRKPAADIHHAQPQPASREASEQI